MNDLQLEIMRVLAGLEQRLVSVQDLHTLLTKQSRKKVNYATAYRNVSRLIKVGVVSNKKYGNYNQININYNDDGTIVILALIEANAKKDFLNKQNKVARALFDKLDTELNKREDVSCAIIFGSYARGTQHADSDVDLMVVLSPLIKNEKQSKDVIRAVIRNIGMEFGEPAINPIVLKMQDFIGMLKADKITVGKEAFKYHILINGFYNFWRYIARSYNETRA